MGESIFISYRRADTGPQVAELARELSNWFGPSQVFHDQQSIEPGQKFPDRLREAVGAARAVLVVIGPQWLTSLRSRLDQDAQLDWVRQEVKLALQREADGMLPVLIPILAGDHKDAKVPTAQQWPAELQKDLGRLSQFQADAVTLAGNKVTSADLRWSLYEQARLPYFLSGGLETPLTALGEQLKAALKSFEMATVLAHWPDPSTAPTAETSIPQQISRFRAAVEKAIPDWLRLQPIQRAAVASGCREILALLYRMAVDFPITREWCADSGSDRPIPAKTLAAAVNVSAVVQGLPMKLGAEDGNEPRFDRVVDLDLAAGVGADRVASVHRELWQNTTALGALSAPAGNVRLPLVDAALRKLKSALADDADAGQPHMLAQEVDAKARVPSESRQLASGLGLPLTAFSKQGGQALRFDEDDLHIRIRSCLIILKTLNH